MYSLTRTNFKSFRTITAILLLSITGLVGCASAPYSYDQEAPLQEDYEPGPGQIANKGADGTDDVISSSARKLHYSGYMKLLVSDPRTTTQSVIDLVDQEGGYIESISQSTIVFHVPFNNFDKSFHQLMSFGKVLDKQVTVEDITTQYRSLELRLSVLRTTLKRLLRLLESVSDDEQKIQLLKQIEEANAEIQKLQATFASLKQKVHYSTITLRLESYNTHNSNPSSFEPEGMSWISRLSPDDDSLARSGKTLKFTVPEGMLHVRNNDSYWSSESGDQVVFRAHSHDNKPKGDTEFWVQAINLRHQLYYSSITSLKVGGYSIIRLVSFDNTPYVYYIGVQARQEKINLVEIFIPSITLEKQYRDAILSSVAQGDI